MRLTELDPHFLLYCEENGRASWRQTDDIIRAQGILFLCPKCFDEHGGPVGTHSVIIWFRDRGVPDMAEPGPARWSVVSESTDYGNLTLTPSIRFPTGCKFHGKVQGGEVHECVVSMR